MLSEFIEFVARSLVEHPDQVEVRPIETEKGMVYELRVAQTDLGKVIGKEGQTAKAMRVLLKAAAARRGERAMLEIVEE